MRAQLKSCAIAFKTIDPGTNSKTMKQSTFLSVKLTTNDTPKKTGKY